MLINYTYVVYKAKKILTLARKSLVGEYDFGKGWKMLFCQNELTNQENCCFRNKSQVLER